MRGRPFPFVFTLALLLSPPAASAQTILGEVLIDGTTEPIVGAFVVLLDSAGNVRGAMLTGDQGRFLLHAPAPGRYRVRAERLGYRTTSSEILDVAAGETLAHTLHLPAEPVALEEIRATGERRCGIRPEEGIRTARVWEAARQALRVQQWTEAEGGYRFRVRLHTRTLDPRTLQIESEEMRPETVLGGRPFASLSAAAMKATGFMVATPDGGRRYHAPDAALLLSDEFVATHCFRVATHPDDSGLVGLHFEPVESRDLPEIEGELWVERTTAELRTLEYRYTNVDLPRAATHGGGRIEFERLPTGAWIVRRWNIRVPEIAIERRVALRRGGYRDVQVVRAIREEGGEVLAVERGSS